MGSRNCRLWRCDTFVDGRTSLDSRVRYKIASVYMYKRRFPDSIFVRRQSLNDADIPKDEYLHRTLHTPAPALWSSALFMHSVGDNCWTNLLGIFNILQLPLPSRSPKKLCQLPLEKNYLLTDAQTIFICLLSIVDTLGCIVFSEDNGRGGQTLSVSWSHSRLTAAFRRQDNPYLAHINLFLYIDRPRPNPINRRTIREYQLIIVDGYPPWYKMEVTNTANVTFAFPSLDNGNLRQGGWIVAVGLGDLLLLPYFSSKLGRFAEIPYVPGRHVRGGDGPY